MLKRSAFAVVLLAAVASTIAIAAAFGVRALPHLSSPFEGSRAEAATITVRLAPAAAGAHGDLSAGKCRPGIPVATNNGWCSPREA